MSEQNKIDEIKAKVPPEDRIVWYSEKEEMFYVGGPVNEQGKRPVIAECLSESVAESFAKSPEYITYLLAKIERKNEALRFYADTKQYEQEKCSFDAAGTDVYWEAPEIMQDLGKRAREAL